jgi:hypothetical protein
MEKMEKTRVASFATRPAQIFENAEVNVAIVTGKKSGEGGSISTTEFLRFNSENRGEVLSNIQYEDIDNLILAEKIGGNRENYAVLPKIGNGTIKSILTKLRDNSDTIISDVYSEDESDPVIWRTYGMRYWTNPMLEELYESDKVKPKYFQSKLERNMSYIAICSSLFYLYWMAYGNERDLNFGLINRFPLPERDKMEANEDRINKLTYEVWERAKRMYEAQGKFEPSPIEPSIEEIDELVSELYGLSEDETEFIQNYHTEYDRGESDNVDLSEFE